MNSYSILKTSALGDLLLVANPTQLIGVYFLGCEHAPVLQNNWVLDPRQTVLAQAREQLQEYLGGSRSSFSLPLHPIANDFQKCIWREIAKIPFGQTITYSDLAARAGNPSALRAAGTATGRNPLGIIVPCHRVVGKNGSIGGYAGGLDKKRHLLQLEQPNSQLKSEKERHHDLQLIGDSIIFKLGEAHQIRNTGNAELVYFVVADHPQADVAIYPDTPGKLVIKPTLKCFTMNEASYYEPEE
jgi:methylated-DNA-[protein]-cysteine S-methyltransferase